jgi:hypothetical protein
MNRPVRRQCSINNKRSQHHNQETSANGLSTPLPRSSVLQTLSPIFPQAQPQIQVPTLLNSFWISPSSPPGSLGSDSIDELIKNAHFPAYFAKSMKFHRVDAVHFKLTRYRKLIKKKLFPGTTKANSLPRININFSHE